MSQNKESHSAATARSPDMPRRQRWNTDDILCMGDDFTYADAAKEIAFLWNEWADSVENILRALIDQLEERDISNDAFLTLAAHVSAYPARPALPAADPTDVSGRLLNAVWNGWADVVEMIAHDMKWAIDHSMSLPKEGQMLRTGGSVDSSPHLANRHPRPMDVAAHLRMTLRDRTVACGGLADFMEFLSIW